MFQSLKRSTMVLAITALGMIGLSALANQSNTWSPTTGTVSGLQITTNYNNAFSAVQSCNSGTAAPANDQTTAAVKGQCWLNTSTTPNTLEQFDGTSWLTLGWLDVTNHQWIPNNAGGLGTIASAGTTDLGSFANPVLSITGTTTITSFGSSALVGTHKFINFTGALTLTHNATSLILPNGGNNITTSAGDTAIAVALGAGNWRVVSYVHASGTALVASLSTIPFAGVMHNGTIVPSVAANALTIAIKTRAGVDPSAGDPVLIVFRDPTTANGDDFVISLTSALSITVPSGATVGTVNGQANRLWLGAFNNGGTIVLGVYNSLNSTGPSVLSWDESTPQSGVAISGSSTSPQTWYTSSTITTKALRVLGYVESTQTTAGTWTASPSKNQLFGPGVQKPGEIVQAQSATTTTAGTTTSATFAALTSGQTISITPRSAANLISVDATGAVSINTTGTVALQLSRGATNNTNLIGSAANAGVGAGGIWNMTAYVKALDVPNTASAQTYALQGKTNAGTLTFGGAGLPTFMSALEIQV